MKFSEAIDDFIADAQRESRINSPNTIRAYRECLELFCDHVGNRDPALVGRNDVKTFLRRWQHPNSQRQKHAILASFGKWTMTEGIRETNPADQVRRARQRQVSVYRPTIPEVIALMDASMAIRRERWVIHLGVLAGLRRQEICGLQGRHLMREGWVWVSPDIGKGNKERWMPVLAELEPIVAEILALTGPTEHVIPSRRGTNTRLNERADVPISGSGLHRLVKRVGHKAGIVHDIGPHTLRHAYGDHVARYAGLKAAQALMGHASVSTTEESYVGRPTLDELAVSLHGFSYRRSSTQTPSVPEEKRTEA